VRVAVVWGWWGTGGALEASGGAWWGAAADADGVAGQGRACAAAEEVGAMEGIGSGETNVGGPTALTRSWDTRHAVDPEVANHAASG
jgi:hypothetical protein